MYGLLLDSIQKFLCERYGEHYWDRIRRRANLQNHWFVTHEVYSDDVLLDLVNAAAIELGEEHGSVMKMFGEYFAKNIGHYGYARLLRVLGRDLRDFLNGLDDLHEYLRFSYPKMCSPSFFCESETEEGLILHYTTKRKGYLQYVIGQLTTVGRIYGKDVEVRVLSEEIAESGTRPIHITMELKFDNSELSMQKQLLPVDKDFSISADTFLGVFPFCILFDKDLIVCREGIKLKEVLPNLVGRHLGDCFTVRKPMIDAISWKLINLQANSVFELVSLSTVYRKTHLHSMSRAPDDDPYVTSPPHLRLKGQMLLLEDMMIVAFLCSPVMDSPEELYESGIYMNDLSMHDSSRDMILAGSQKDPELKIALSQEKIRSAQLEDSIQQTDRLLFQMIPKPIADQLRNGETPLNTCREFSSVSILFSDIVSFTPMCSRLHPMEVVCVLNAMCVAFDRLCETHHVYKVETIGDAYMVICGAPVTTVYHAEYVTAFGLDIIQATSKINDPSTGQSIRVRVGIHSGNIVAGVVGSTVLRYDVFGDTVNVAARMEATGAPMKVHVSQTTAQLLKGTPFNLEARGSMDIKGKGHMNTYWVVDKTGGSAVVPKSSPPIPVRRAAVLPIIQRPPESKERPKSASLIQTPSPKTPSSGPKPNEWPQANIRLRRFTTDAIDHSVPPGLRINLDRRNTVPAVPVGLIDQHSPNLQLNRKVSTGSLPTGEVTKLMGNPILNLERVCKVMPTSSTERLTVEEHEPLHSLSVGHDTQSQSSSPGEPISFQGDPEAALGCPVFGQEMDMMSEMNLMHVRHASGSMPVYPQSSAQAMEQFAMQAERNVLQAERSAQQARQLSDWANSIVQQLKTGGPVQPPQQTTNPAIANHRERLLEGTSVDPTSSIDSSTHSVCPVSHSTPAQASPEESNGKERCDVM